MRKEKEKPSNLVDSNLSDFSMRRRTFLQAIGTGLLVTVIEPGGRAQNGQAESVVSRIYVNSDGSVTALSGKVEEGQGPRAELTQAAAEELRIPASRVHLTMADTELVPDDGITAGSRTTPRNVPEMRRAAASAREILRRLAAENMQTDPDSVVLDQGGFKSRVDGRTMTFAQLAESATVGAAFSESVRTDIPLTRILEWEVLGESIPRPNARDLVTGRHRFPSDIIRPGMLYGKVLRPPAFGATLESIDLSGVRKMEGVSIIQESTFVGVAAANSLQAEKALHLAEAGAVWKTPRNTVSHRTVHDHLKTHAKRTEARTSQQGDVEQALDTCKTALAEVYTLAYIQHAPMEPRAAVAEWNDQNLTVWAGCDGPFRARADLAREFGLLEERVRVVIPDMGGGFGGKHSAEAALEAARMARVAGRPVWVRWTRAEEFAWAYCRPAAVIECRAGLNETGKLVAWEFANINAGGSAIDPPYSVENFRISTVGSDSPLRQGSYRCLAATGNNFARESFMDELASVSGTDPLDFRLAHLENLRLRRVLETAAERFNWRARRRANRAVGIACGTEKNSVVAACVEVEVDRKSGRIRVLEVCEAFECGPILNPANLLSQVQGCIVMGLGGALTEELEFENGMISNSSFTGYQVPRFKDVPQLDIHLIDNPDMEPAGGGETPIIAVAPAIGNAVFAATGIRLRSMPIRGDALRQA